MVKLSAEQKLKNQNTESVKESFVNKHKVNFKVDTLNKLFNEDMNTFLNSVKDADQKEYFMKLISTGLINKELFMKEFKNTYEYMCKYIIHGTDANWYMLTKAEDGSIFPRQYKSNEFEKLYVNYFNDSLIKWFKKSYNNIHELVLDNEKKRFYDEVDEDGSKDYYFNLFNGYRFNKYEPENKIHDSQKENIEFFWNHIKNVWCSGSEKHFKLLQHIFRKIMSGHKSLIGVYIKGDQGIGKGLVTDIISEVIGLKLVALETNDHAFTGQFNGHLMGKALIVLNEIKHTHTADSFKCLYNSIKPYITDDNMSYRNLFEKAIVLKNLSSVIMSGNYDMMSFSEDDRRWLILDPCNIKQTDSYFSRLAELKKNEDFLYSLFWDSVNKYDSNFIESSELKKLPMTQNKIAMIQNNMNSVDKFLRGILTGYSLSYYHLNKNGKDCIKTKDFYELYKKFHDNKYCLQQLQFYGEIEKNYGKEKGNIIANEAVYVSGTNNKMFIINLPKLIEIFKQKNYLTEYDDIIKSFLETHEQKQSVNGLDDNVNEQEPKQEEPEEDPKDIIIQEQNKQIEELKKQIEELKKQLEEKNKEPEYETESETEETEIEEIDNDWRENIKNEVSKFFKKD